MREGTPATREIADAVPTEVERELATEIVRHGTDAERLVELVAVAVATARRAGYAAGLEERADDAHASGYAEALSVLRAALVDGNGSHDCLSCRDTGQLHDGRTCPLCDGFGKL